MNASPASPDGEERHGRKGPHGVDLTGALHHPSSEVIDPDVPDTGAVLHGDDTEGDDPAHPIRKRPIVHDGAAWFPAD